MLAIKGSAGLTGLLLCLGVCLSVYGSTEQDSRGDGGVSSQCSQTSVILLGANGDLAKRYLWQAVFDYFISFQTGRELNSLQASSDTFLAVSATRKLMARDDLLELVNSSVSCDSQPVSVGPCMEYRRQFLDGLLAVKLKDAGDYEPLRRDLQERAAVNSCVEKRLFYLAIPAFAFQSAAESIGTRCRPDSLPGSWLRVVFEKPFGHDLASATDLAQTVGKFLQRDEILLIDHYLGKTGVMVIQELRTLLAKSGNAIWSGTAVSQIDINVKEQLDAAGRTRFYDSYGVVRDMLQNHLTSMLVLLTCHIDNNQPACTLQSRLDILNSIEPIHPNGILLGQYADYNRHVCEDNSALCRGSTSRTATYASVLLRLTSDQWKGVPMVLMSGKAMGERHAFISLHLRQSAVNSSCHEPRLIINIQGGLHGTSLLIPAELTGLLKSPPNGWQWVDDVILDDCRYRSAKPQRSSQAYSELLQSALSDPSGRFMDIESLLASWRVWSDPVSWLSYLPIRLYTPESVQANHLQTGAHHRTLQYTMSEIEHRDASPSAHGMKDGEAFLRGVLLVASQDKLIDMLVESIVQHAQKAAQERGSFHLALPGGSSPRALLLALSASAKADLIPWGEVHVWQVDERCVHPVEQSVDSNFLQLSAMLLRHRPIHAENIHPMPIVLSHGICSVEDDVAGAYSAQLAMYVNSTMDLAVLGVGEDGHVASLFPQFKPSDYQGDVAITERPGVPNSAKRMTMTYEMLYRARSISFLALGPSKAQIVGELRNADATSNLPAARVSLHRSEETTWYVDSYAAALL